MPPTDDRAEPAADREPLLARIERRPDDDRGDRGEHVLRVCHDGARDRGGFAGGFPLRPFDPGDHWEKIMGLESILVWLVVGLVAGLLASFVVGGGFGLVGDILVGIAGAFIGGAIFNALGVDSPFGGIAGTIFIAFVGAVVLLAVLRLARGGFGGRRRAARV